VITAKVADTERPRMTAVTVAWLRPDLFKVTIESVEPPARQV